MNQEEAQNKKTHFYKTKANWGKNPILQKTEETLLFRKQQKNQSISTKVRNKASKSNSLSPLLFNVMFENLPRDIKIRN